MSESTIIIRHKGGTKEHTATIGEIQIPDLRHVAMLLAQLATRQDDSRMQVASDQVLECWQLCHDLRRHILEQEK